VNLTLVVGGTRSGKSAHAEALAAQTGLPVRYVATADPDDLSIAERIARHRRRRPAGWTTVEAGRPARRVANAPFSSLGAALADSCSNAGGECVLLDGLGPWIASILHLAGAFEDASRLPAAGARVLEGIDLAARALASAGAAIVVVEQAGAGVLPPDAASRAWVDLLGEATQLLAAGADRVDMVLAGRAITLGGDPTSPGSPTPGGGPRCCGSPGPDDDPSFSGPPGLVETDDRATLDGGSLRHHGDRELVPGHTDHAVNVVAGGPPRWLRAALVAALADGAGHYPREDDAIAAIADLHGRRPDEIVPTNGAAEALWLLGPALRPRLAACIHPGFTETEAALRAHRVPVVRVFRDPDRDFVLDPASVPEDADLVVVGNPASPSGTLDPATAILGLRRPGRTVVVDEAFMDLVSGQAGSVTGVRLDDVIVVRSVTKALGVPGLRAGYAVAARRLADRLRAVRPAWSANVVALAALRAAAEHPEEIAAIAERSAGEREDLYERLAAIPGVRVWPGAANFVLVAVDRGPTVVAAFRAQRIAIRPAASFPGLDGRYIRITARDPRRNARVAAVLRTAVALERREPRERRATVELHGRGGTDEPERLR
jgi:histidinol-phosphate/aromatic aminotransferase/cobyric acid decarboxylase-like protein/adenosyl cobinamide kinase/adenosyl cobinamide phosphate guanylyltransferase